MTGWMRWLMDLTREILKRKPSSTASKISVIAGAACH